MSDNRTADIEGKKEQAADFAQALQAIQQAVQQLGQLATAPREIVRDAQGKAVGVSVAGQVRPILRGPDGRVLGVQ